MGQNKNKLRPLPKYLSESNIYQMQTRIDNLQHRVTRIEAQQEHKSTIVKGFLTILFVVILLIIWTVIAYDVGRYYNTNNKINTTQKEQ